MFSFLGRLLSWPHCSVCHFDLYFLTHLPCPWHKRFTLSPAQSLSFSLFLSVSQLCYLWFLSLPWHEGYKFVMFLKSRRHIFKVSSGSAELPRAWLKVRGKPPPTPVMGCISWKLTLRQNLVCKIILKECL